MAHIRYEMEGLGKLFNKREEWREQMEDIPELAYRMMEDDNDWRTETTVKKDDNNELGVREVVISEKDISYQFK